MLPLNILLNIIAVFLCHFKKSSPTFCYKDHKEEVSYLQKCNLLSWCCRKPFLWSLKCYIFSFLTFKMGVLHILPTSQMNI